MSDNDRKQTVAEVREAFGKSYATVSRAVKAIELASVD